MDFEARLDVLDISLVQAIPSQSTDDDKISWLALQRAVRRAHAPYTYLEIGSHLGGSIQQHLLDPKCGRIYSIDMRPVDAPDARGVIRYGSSTNRMLENLRQLDQEAVSKVTCFDADARAIDTAEIDMPPDYCFIDGAHTTRAVLSDFAFCRRVCAGSAVISFHDDGLIYPALVQICRDLRREGQSFRALTLGGSTFALFLGGHPAGTDEAVQALAKDGDGLDWIRSHRRVDVIRHFAARRLPRVLRAVRALRTSLKRLRG